MLEPVAAANGGWPKHPGGAGRTAAGARSLLMTGSTLDCSALGPWAPGWPRPAMSGWSPAPARWILASPGGSGRSAYSWSTWPPP
jgi:hypothetical protein